MIIVSVYVVDKYRPTYNLCVVGVIVHVSTWSYAVERAECVDTAV